MSKPQPIENTCLAWQGKRLVYVGTQKLTGRAEDEAFADADKLGYGSVWVMGFPYIRVGSVWCTSTLPPYKG